MLDSMIRAWRGEPVAGGGELVVPDVSGGTIPLLIGGYGEPGVRRAVRYGIGWTAGVIPRDQVAPAFTGAGDAVAATALRTPKAVHDAIDQYTDAGVD
jgi:alkanesulfonate monooxygenase SsuD/methylene tetrahydromethanopterin reductase-like flavin-dependent oxidoreductase (luciferase family)